MKDFIREIKDRIICEISRRKEEQELREEKLRQLEENQKKGFKLLHPVQANENRKEIKKLKKEIKEHNEKRKNQKLIMACIGLFVFLFGFIGIMSAVDSGKDSENTRNYDYLEEDSDEYIVEETNADKEVLTTDNSEEEIATQEETEITETTIHIHEFQDATCSSPKLCLICGEKSGEKLDHSYKNGVCLGCGENDPYYVEDEMVWIPTNGGTKYHVRSSCSQMDNPIYVTRSEAINRGFSPCGRCY